MKHIEIISPKISTSKHQGYIFDNGLKCIIAHDADIEESAVSMTVGVGKLNDPAEIPGLAHFCEHMLFMGTKKYPNEDEYSSYIGKNNGSTNAYTSDMETTYYFSVSHSALEGSLERFLEFFIDPSFHVGSIQREILAVHSEYEKNYSVNGWRIGELQKNFFNQEHPLSRFGSGNITTLQTIPSEKNIDLRDRLLSFFSNYYVSEAMCLVVYTPLEPKKVLEIIVKSASRIKKGTRCGFRFLKPGTNLFSANYKHAWVNSRSIDDKKNIVILWPVQSPVSLWKSSPGNYISSILGHESRTSVLGVLQKRKLANALVTYFNRADDDNEIMNVSMSLTQSGLENILEVIKIVYQGIGRAIENGINIPVYQQIKKESALIFECYSAHDPSDHVCDLSSNALKTDLPHSWCGATLIIEDNLDAVLNFTKQLTPDNAIVCFSWGSFPCEGESTVDELFHKLPEFARKKANEKTLFHEVNFSNCVIPESVRNDWAAALRGPFPPEIQLPSVNPFIATDFTVFPVDQQSSQLLEQFKSEYGVCCIGKRPKGCKTFQTALRINIFSPISARTPVEFLYNSLMVTIMNRTIMEISYMGYLASISNSISPNPSGFLIVIDGPFENLVDFFLQIIEKITDSPALESSKEEYDVCLHSLFCNLKNKANGQPYAHCEYFSRKLVTLVQYTFEELLSAHEGASYEGYKAFITEFLRNGFLCEFFVSGNMPSASSMKADLMDKAESIFKKRNIPAADRSCIPRVRDSFALSLRENPDKTSPLTIDVLTFPPFNPNQSNTGVLLSIYLGKATPEITSLGKCIRKLLESPLFDSLRTLEGLGYVVFVAQKYVNGTSYLNFSVQSALPEIDGLYLFSRIFAFTDAVSQNLSTIFSESNVRCICEGLIQKNQQIPSSIERECMRLEAEFLQSSKFDHLKEETNVLEKLSATEVAQFYQTHIANSRTNARSLLIIVNSPSSDKIDPFKGDGPFKLTLPPKIELVSTMSSESETATRNIVLSDFKKEAPIVHFSKISSLTCFKSEEVVRSHTF